jgi:hypothetical protein
MTNPGTHKAFIVAFLLRAFLEQNLKYRKNENRGKTRLLSARFPRETSFRFEGKPMPSGRMFGRFAGVLYLNAKDVSQSPYTIAGSVSGEVCLTNGNV